MRDGTSPLLHYRPEFSIIKASEMPGKPGSGKDTIKQVKFIPLSPADRERSTARAQAHRKERQKCCVIRNSD